MVQDPSHTTLSLVTGDLSFSTDLDRPGNALLCTFGGISQGIGMPAYEFRKVTDPLPAKLAFIRDLSQSWYHSSLPGIGCGIQDLSAYVHRLCSETKVEKLVCIGNSMGGYAALVVGALAKADLVIAIVPQTFISHQLRQRHNDERWPHQISNTLLSRFATPQAFDLRTYLADPGFTEAIVYADRADNLDATHAEWISEVPRVRLMWKNGGHNLVKNLRDTGELQTLLANAVSKGHGNAGLPAV
jgi:pimeloyl-ACP methyl ester carboxylesterase